MFIHITYTLQKSIIFLLVIACFLGCATKRGVVIDYLDQYEISPNTRIQNTVVGGLSGIDFNTNSKTYYLVTDDRSAHNNSRFYSADIVLKSNKIDTIRFLKSVAILNKEKTFYKKESVDFESIRYNPKHNELIVGDEGGKEGKPSIKIIDIKGNHIKEFKMDSNYINQIRSNKSIESISFSKDFESVFYATEAPLENDGNIPSIENGGLIRIIESNLDGVIKKEFLYELEKVPYAATKIPPWKGTGSDNGLSEILSFGKNQFLTLEHSGAYQTDGTFKFTCKVFLVKAKIKKNENGLKTYKTVKKEVVDFSKFPNGKFNIEGMTLGPIIHNKQSVLFISDNNFKDTIPTMLYLFTITNK